MKPTLLLPSGFKIIGLILLIGGLVVIYLFLFRDRTFSFLSYGKPTTSYTEFTWTGRDNLTDETAITLIIIGLLFIGFSKVNKESGATHKIRLKALYSSVFAICMLTIIFLVLDNATSRRGTLFNFILYQLFFLLPVFILRFYYLLFRFKKSKKRPTLYLLPYKPFNLLGKIVSLGCLALALGSLLSGIKVTDNISFVCLTGVLFWISSKEKKETRDVTEIRLKAMRTAVYINYFLLLISTWAFYGFDYLVVLSIGLVSIQVVFLIVFYWMTFKASKQAHSHAVS